MVKSTWRGPAEVEVELVVDFSATGWLTGEGDVILQVVQGTFHGQGQPTTASLLGFFFAGGQDRAAEMEFNS